MRCSTFFVAVRVRPAMTIVLPSGTVTVVLAERLAIVGFSESVVVPTTEAIVGWSIMRTELPGTM